MSIPFAEHSLEQQPLTIEEIVALIVAYTSGTEEFEDIPF